MVGSNICFFFVWMLCWLPHISITKGRVLQNLNIPAGGTLGWECTEMQEMCNPEL